MSTEPFRRNPLIISGNSLSSGGHSTTFPSGHPDSLLRSYLIFVRDLRGQRREPSIELRSEDVSVLAGHLGVSEELVLGGLLDLMGATRAQRSAMLAMLAAGALTLVLTGSLVTDLSSDGVSVEMTRLAAAVQSAVQHPDPDGAGAAAAIGETTPSTPMGARTVAVAPTPTVDVLLSVADATRSRPADEEQMPVERVTARSADVVEVVDRVAAEPVSIAVAPDGSLVASVAPPTTPAAHDDDVATAELPDGTTVGVAAPPVPPTDPAPEGAGDDQTAIAQLPDGSTVGVAAPPVPPTPVPPATGG